MVRQILDIDLCEEAKKWYEITPCCYPSLLEAAHLLVTSRFKHSLKEQHIGLMGNGSKSGRVTKTEWAGHQDDTANSPKNRFFPMVKIRFLGSSRVVLMKVYQRN